MNDKSTWLILLISIYCLLFIPANGICLGDDKNADSVKLIKEYEFNVHKAETITNGQKSLKYSLKALEISKKLNQHLYIAQSYIEISQDYERLGNLKSALFYILLAAKFYEKQNYQSNLGITLNHIGTIYFNQGNKYLAVSYINRAIDVHKRLNIPKYIGDDYNNLGEIYRLSKEYEYAMRCFRQAYNIFSNNRKGTRFAYSAGNIGLVYAAQNKMDSANYYLTLSTNILKKKGDFNPITVYLIETANIYFKHGNTIGALAKAKEALDISTGENLREQLRDVNKLLADIYLQSNDFKNAYHALYEYSRYKDSISNSKIVSDMAEMRADYEVSKKETEITGLQAVNKLRNRINIGLGCGILLITILSIFLFRLNKRMKTANKLLSLQKIELEQKNEIVKSSLLEKETLLKEIHHRVKNNLQIISSLLSMQSQNVKNKKAREAFYESQQRLHSIALIHQKLYQNKNLADINIKEYVGDLTDAIHNTFNSTTKNIKCNLYIADVNLDIDTALPLGLIINELVTNAYKYAFNLTKEGEITIRLQRKDNDGYTLMVKDNGAGLPENLNIFETESLGLKLVSILSRQLGGKIEVKSTEGTEFCLDFIDVIQHTS